MATILLCLRLRLRLRLRLHWHLRLRLRLRCSGDSLLTHRRRQTVVAVFFIPFGSHFMPPSTWHVQHLSCAKFKHQLGCVRIQRILRHRCRCRIGH